MPQPTIIRGRDHFNTFIYEGNGQGQRVGNFIPVTQVGSANGSCVFNYGSNCRLERDSGGTAASSQTTYTWSAWCRLGYSGENYPAFFNINDETEPYDYFFFNKTSGSQGGAIQFYSYGSSAYNIRRVSNRTFEMGDKFYHFVVRVDTTQSTADDRCRIYVDGEQITSWTGDYANPSQGFTSIGHGQSSADYNIGGYGTSRNWDGQMSQIIFTDGQSYGPETFGQTDTSSGRWIPKSLGSITYGNRGYRLDFGAPADLGNDSSGNDNDFTPVELPQTRAHSLSSPTNEYPAMDDYQGSYLAGYSNAQMRFSGSTSSQSSMARSTISFDVEDSTGYYCEFKNVATSSFGSNFNGYGIVGTEADGVSPSSGALFPNGGPHVMLQEDGNVRIRVGKASAEQNLGAATLPKTGNTSTRDTVGVAVKSGKIWFAKNGVWGNANQGNPNSDGTPIVSGLKGRFRFAAALYQTNATQEVNFGDRKILSGTSTNNYFANNNGFFVYPPPTGFRALTKDSVPDTEDKTGITRASEGVVDFTWIKNRDNNTHYYTMVDSSRGVQNEIYSNGNFAEVPDTADSVMKFLKGGIDIEDAININTLGNGYVAWNWHANGGTTAANTDGSGASIASTTQANQDAGFSIVQWTGTGSNGTVAHGLTSAPEYIIVKNRTVAGQSWHVFIDTPDMGNGKAQFLDTNSAASSSSQFWNNTSPTNKVFTVGTSGGVNQDTKTMLAYCFHSVAGYSKIGFYQGNGNTNGPFVFTGFKPQMILLKASLQGSGAYWMFMDDTRWPINGPDKTPLFPDGVDGDLTGGLGVQNVDFFSNGFKLKTSEQTSNKSAYEMTYLAFAKHPFIGNGTNPVTAF